MRLWEERRYWPGQPEFELQTRGVRLLSIEMMYISGSVVITVSAWTSDPIWTHRYQGPSVWTWVPCKFLPAPLPLLWKGFTGGLAKTHTKHGAWHSIVHFLKHYDFLQMVASWFLHPCSGNSGNS